MVRSKDHQRVLFQLLFLEQTRHTSDSPGYGSSISCTSAPANR